MCEQTFIVAYVEVCITEAGKHNSAARAGILQ